MAKQHEKPFRFCLLIFVSLCIFSSISFFIWWSHCSSTCCYSQSNVLLNHNENRSIDLFEFPSPWNVLDFSSRPPPPGKKLLKIALFVKKWPDKHRSGGLERHAMTLHLALAARGHQIHVFTADNPLNDLAALSFPNVNNLFFHLSEPTSAGYLDQQVIWKQFEKHNASGGRPFDVIHTESVALMHTRSRNHTNLAVSWHGIAYESIHSDIIQQLLLLSRPDEQQRPLTTNFLTKTSMKVIKEVRNFQSYAHHVATSNHAGDVLKRIYMIPEKRVHIILNGVDENIFKPDPEKGRRFKSRFGIPQSKPKPLILGIAGRLVKDKGHPLMFEALKQIFKENSAFKQGVMILVAGNGPWRSRYKELGSGGGPNNDNVVIVGQLGQNDLCGFYNAIDVFVNPTLRAQGLDHTLLEAVVTGKAVMATKLASITETVIVDKETGYTFNPNVESLKAALYEVWRDGGIVLKKKGLLARERGLKLFTASKMAAAYEKLFLCLAQQQGEEEQTDHNCMYMY